MVSLQCTTSKKNILKLKMKLERLRIQGLRCLTQVEMQLSEGLHILVGANGAGKTAVLEAAYMLSHGRSFRSGTRDALLQRGAETMAVFSAWRTAKGSPVRLGLGQRGKHWDARIDGQQVKLAQLVRECAVVCFEPGSHSLIAGGAEGRRHYLDWGVFHVEHAFLDTWRRYQRALKQRNYLLRNHREVSTVAYLPWEKQLGELAQKIDMWRRRYIDHLMPYLRAQTQALLPELGSLECHYRKGWAEDQRLEVLLAENRSRDVVRGHTSQGAHRADWTLHFEHAPWREHLSRGQEKLSALSCLLAQATVHAQQCGIWPLICLDDLSSELDVAHQALVMSQLQASSAQVLVTGTEFPPLMSSFPACLFHVEQGQVWLENVAPS